MGSQATGRVKPYEARWRDPDGRERSPSFDRKLDAQRFLATVEADKLRGSYVDPNAGKVTLQAFAESWLATQTTDPATVEAVASRLRVHVYPHLGSFELRAIRPSVLQGWLAQLQATLAPTYVRVILANVSAILGAAVEDGMLAKNPARSKAVRAPRVDAARILPWSTEQVEQVRAAHPERYRAVPVVAAGCGLRQGEVFGLAVEDVDFLGRWVLVRQQVKLLKGKPVLAPPKGGKTREVPLPEVVVFTLAEHLRRYPPVEVTLPWRDFDGRPVTAALVFVTRERGPLTRRHYNVNVWKPALVAAGVEPTRANGMHALRHHYASVLLDGGVSIRPLAEHLGHADPGFTLWTYTHLMPSSEDRAREAVDAALGRLSRGPDVAQAGPLTRRLRRSEGCSVRCRNRDETRVGEDAGAAP